MPEQISLEALSIMSDPERIRDARGWLAEIARKAGFEEEEVRELALALSEACANVHRHAYAGRTEGRIDIQVEVEKEKLQVAVRDYGVPFDSKDYSPPNLEEPTEGGYGLYLITHLMDAVRYVDMGVGTRVVMVKNRRLATVEGTLP